MVTQPHCSAPPKTCHSNCLLPALLDKHSVTTDRWTTIPARYRQVPQPGRIARTWLLGCSPRHPGLRDATTAWLAALNHVFDRTPIAGGGVGCGREWSREGYPEITLSEVPTR